MKYAISWKMWDVYKLDRGIWGVSNRLSIETELHPSPKVSSLPPQTLTCFYLPVTSCSVTDDDLPDNKTNWGSASQHTGTPYTYTECFWDIRDISKHPACRTASPWAELPSFRHRDLALKCRGTVSSNCRQVNTTTFSTEKNLSIQ